MNKNVLFQELCLSLELPAFLKKHKMFLPNSCTGMLPILTNIIDYSINPVLTTTYHYSVFTFICNVTSTAHVYFFLGLMCPLWAIYCIAPYRHL